MKVKCQPMSGGDPSRAGTIGSTRIAWLILHPCHHLSSSTPGHVAEEAAASSSKRRRRKMRRLLSIGGAFVAAASSTHIQRKICRFLSQGCAL